MVRDVLGAEPIVVDGRQRLNKGEINQNNAFIAHYARMTTCTDNIGNTGFLRQGSSHQLALRLRDGSAATNGQETMASGPQRDRPD
jgi:hypothetical protein